MRTYILLEEGSRDALKQMEMSTPILSKEIRMPGPSSFQGDWDAQMHPLKGDSRTLRGDGPLIRLEGW